MSIGSEICNFYKETIAPGEITSPEKPPGFKKTFPISNLHFAVGAVFATVILVQKIVYSILFLVGYVLTLGFHEEIKNSLLSNARKTLVYAGAIPLGILGIFRPQTINQEVLHIPAEGLSTRYNSPDEIFPANN